MSIPARLTDLAVLGGEGAASTLGLTQRQTTTHIQTSGQFRLMNSSNKHVFGRWGRGVHGEYPHKHRENIQTVHRKAEPRKNSPTSLLEQSNFPVLGLNKYILF